MQFKKLFTVTIIALFGVMGYSQRACITVSSASCSAVNGNYVQSVDGVYYESTEMYTIRYRTNRGPSPLPPGWYLRDESRNDYFYIPSNDDQNLPTEGWQILDPICSGGMRDDPADLVIQFIDCERTGPCYFVDTDCSDLRGVYQQSTLIAYEGRPVYYDEDGNEIFWNGESWRLFTAIEDETESQYENKNDTPTLPLSGWENLDRECPSLPVTITEVNCGENNALPTLDKWRLFLLGLLLTTLGGFAIRRGEWM